MADGSGICASAREIAVSIPVAQPKASALVLHDMGLFNFGRDTKHDETLVVV